MLDPGLIHFRPLAMADLPQIHQWLNHTPAVREFIANGESTPYEKVAAKYGPRVRGETPTSCYLIQHGDTPIGHIQTYLWRSYPEYARYLDLQEEAASLDVWIGHEAYLHQGLGRYILRAFLRDVIFVDGQVQSCVITPEERNVGAIRAYEKAGFTCLRVIEHPDEPGPVAVLRIGRAEVEAWA